MSKVFKVRWTVVESEVYEVEANSFQEACNILDAEFDMPDEIVELKMEEVVEVKEV